MSVSALALALAILLPIRADPRPTVTCHVSNDPRARTFVLDQSEAPKSWRLLMQDRDSASRWIRLSLPGAAPTIGRGVASLAYKNANGGRQVTLDVSPDRSRLDVYVDHGLEVNIEPDLDPDVDRMNTNGPLTALACTVAQ